MDSKPNKVKLAYNPRKDANILSVLFFSWILPLLNKGYRKDLEQQDLFEPLDNDHSEVLGNRLEREWMKELNGTKKDCETSNNKGSDESAPNLRNAFKAFSSV